MPCLNDYSPLVICVIYVSGGPAKATIAGLIVASMSACILYIYIYIYIFFSPVFILFYIILYLCICRLNKQYSDSEYLSPRCPAVLDDMLCGILSNLAH